MSRRCCPTCGTEFVRVGGVYMLAVEVALRRWVEKLERVIARGK